MDIDSPARIAEEDKSASIIWSFAEAPKAANVEDKTKLLELKEYFINSLVREIPEVSFNGLSADMNKSAPHILSVRFPIDKPMLLFNLDLKGIATSGGSACQSGSSKGSHVLAAILNENEAKHTSVRFSFSRFNTKKEVDLVIKELSTILAK